MTVELRPLGVTCNLACRYCYQDPQREAGNAKTVYDLETMKSAAARIGGPFTLFGGEPLLIRLPDLEHLFAWGLETHGQNAIQTNGALIEDAHIALFRRYKVSVGISIDGPGDLNDARWNRGLAKTRQATDRVSRSIERLCREHEPPGLIVTLHRGNATGDKLGRMADWLRHLDALGVTSVRLHLLEVDHASVRDSLSLSARENVAALSAFAALEESLPRLRFDLFREMENLLAGRDAGASCTWRACDPYTTDAVQGVEGDGQASNCGRTNKDGIGFIKADAVGYERYLALFRTPEADGGCAGCRFFLMCKGQCPGTAIDGDWRNRTEHCAEWKEIFARIEQRMIRRGVIPLTIQPIRFDMEQRQAEHWVRGENPSMSFVAAALGRERAGGDRGLGKAPAPRPRTSFVGDAARDLWGPRIARIQGMIEDMTVHVASKDGLGLQARVVPADSLPRLRGLAAGAGLAVAVLPATALPAGISTRPGRGSAVTFVAGSASAVARAEAALGRGDRSALLGGLPPCCAQSAGMRALPAEEEVDAVAAISAGAPIDGTVLDLSGTARFHPLLAPLGLSVLPVVPCSLTCGGAERHGEGWSDLAEARGYQDEVEWLRQCLAWAVDWSERHGIVEVKTPVFKLSLWTGSPGPPRRIRRLGSNVVEGSVGGLGFPFAAPRRPGQRPAERPAP